MFQFQSGTIKSEIDEYEKVIFSCFNSNLVRLKVNKVIVMKDFVIKFQFQSGTIKSGNFIRATDLSNEFQFQSGTIKRNLKAEFHTLPKSFNSNLVRLKAFPPGLGCQRGKWFQFQSGTIKR